MKCCTWSENDSGNDIKSNTEGLTAKLSMAKIIPTLMPAEIINSLWKFL